MIRGIWCLLIAVVSASVAQADSQPQLQQVNYSTTGSGFQLQLEFDQPYDASQVSVDLINHTVQLNLPKTNFVQKKTIQPVKDQKIKSIYTYQAETGLVRSRIIYFSKHKSEGLAGKIKVESKDNTILVSIVDSAVAVPAKSAEALPLIPPNDLDSELARALESAAPEAGDALMTVSTKSSSAAADIVANELAESAAPLAETPKSQSNLPEDKIPVLSADKSSAEKTSTKSPYWRMAASLVIIIVFAGALMMGAKYWTRNRVRVQDQTKIRVLTQHHLGPKKTLAIIQVAGESILIGVTDHNINLIKTLALLDEEIPADAPASFAKELNRAGIGEDEVVDRSNLRRPSGVVRKSEDDEISLGKIQSQIADRLKEMRSL